jgi:hypothetical protein
MAENQTVWPVEPEPGTVAWVVAKRDMLRTALREEKFNKELAQTLFQRIEQSGAWRLLSDMHGRSFSSFDAFCESSNGLGFKRQEIERRLTAQEMAADSTVPPMLKHGADQSSRKAKERHAVVMSFPGSGSNSVAYIVRRLKRDAPEIAEALARGEYRSAHAAAVAAGFKVQGAPLTDARRAWKRLSAEERETFLREITGAEATP